MIAGQVGIDLTRRHAKLIGETHTAMALGTPAAHIRRRHRGTGIRGGFDSVNSVAVGAHWRLPVAARDRLAVDALYVFLLDVVVALGAGCGNVEFANRRLGIGGGENIVLTMTVRAHRSLVGTCSHGFAVDTLLVRVEGSGAYTARCHDEFLSVTGAAGSRNVAPRYF